MTPGAQQLWPAALALVAFGGLLSFGCGDDESSESGIDRSDPEAVAAAYAESYYSCGEDGAGVRAELAYPETAATEHRDEVAEEEKPAGCEPEPVKQVTTAEVPSREPGIPAVVEISNEDCSPSEVPMIEVDGEWYVDETEISPELLCNPYAP